MYFGHDGYLQISGCQTNPLILPASYAFTIWTKPVSLVGQNRRRLQLSNNSTLLSSSSGNLGLTIAESPSSTTFTTTLNTGFINTTTLLGGPLENSWTSVSVGSDFYSSSLLLTPRARRHLQDLPGTTTNSIVLNGNLES